MSSTYELNGEPVDLETYRKALHEHRRDQIEAWFAMAYLEDRDRRSSD